MTQSMNSLLTCPGTADRPLYWHAKKMKWKNKLNMENIYTKHNETYEPNCDGTKKNTDQWEHLSTADKLVSENEKSLACMTAY